MVDALLDRRRPGRNTAEVGERIHDELPRHAGDRALARGVDVGHRDVVGRGESASQLAREVTRARVEVRLEEHPQAPLAEALANRLDRGGDLARVVAVVVDDRHVACLLDLEAAARTREAREMRRRLVARDTGELERGERRTGVPAVVLPGNGELAVPRRCVADEVLGARSPAAELVLELGQRCELAVVVELDVRHDGDRRGQAEDGAVGLVALDDEPPRARAGVRAELRNRRADQPGGIATALEQHERDHRGDGSLAVRAGDDDRASQRHELREEPGSARSGDLAIRARHDHLPAGRHDGLGRDLQRQLETVEVRRPHAVPAAHVRTPCGGEPGVRGETCPADADEPEPPPGQRLLRTRQARSGPRRSPPRRSASRRGASPRPCVPAARDRPASTGRDRARPRGRARAP